MPLVISFISSSVKAMPVHTASFAGPYLCAERNTKSGGLAKTASKNQESGMLKKKKRHVQKQKKRRVYVLSTRPAVDSGDQVLARAITPLGVCSVDGCWFRVIEEGISLRYDVRGYYSRIMSDSNSILL